LKPGGGQSTEVSRKESTARKPLKQRASGKPQGKIRFKGNPTETKQGRGDSPLVKRSRAKKKRRGRETEFHTPEKRKKVGGTFHVGGGMVTQKGLLEAAFPRGRGKQKGGRTLNTMIYQQNGDKNVGALKKTSLAQQGCRQNKDRKRGGKKRLTRRQ